MVRLWAVLGSREFFLKWPFSLSNVLLSIQYAWSLRVNNALDGGGCDDDDDGRPTTTGLQVR